MFSSATVIQELPYASYRHQNGSHHLKTVACSTTSYNSSAERRFHQISKILTYKYSRMLIDTYPGILGWIDCREECWQHQRLVEIIKYFATSSDYLRMRHGFRRESGGVFCTFISEGRMFSTLKGLNSTNHKGKYYMIPSSSFALHPSNSI